MYADNINRLLKKYSEKQPAEIWSLETNARKEKIKIKNEQIRLFDGINSEYFRLVGTQKDRVKYLIKKLDFNKFCPRCTSEQMIVMICYFVKCEYYKKSSRLDFTGVFRKYKVSAFLLDRFMIYLVECVMNNEI